jgi:xanthine dehydrogenase accessory factor
MHRRFLYRKLHWDRQCDRLYAPVGLDIGAKTPETIALAIVSEIQAVLAARPGGSFSKQGAMG